VQAGHLQTSIRKFGLALPFLISPENDIYDGHQRRQLLRIMKEYGQDVDIPCRMSSRMLTDDERRELVVRLKENQGEWDWDMVPNLYDVEELGEWGMPEWKIEELLPDDEPENQSKEQARQTLAERFVVPPFSVLDARQGYWQDRKRAWVALGIESELGRGITNVMTKRKQFARTFGQDLMRGEHVVGGV
jgi:hypothetical protein